MHVWPYIGIYAHFVWAHWPSCYGSLVGEPTHRAPSGRTSACVEPGESVGGEWLSQTVLVRLKHQRKTVRDV